MLSEDRLSNALQMHTRATIDLKEVKIGYITSVNPLQVKVEGNIIPNNFIYFNTDLLEHKINFNNLHGTVGDHETTISNGSFYVPMQLSVGDMVAMVKMNNGKYYLSSRITLGGGLVG